jgi:hypothetical protein
MVVRRRFQTRNANCANVLTARPTTISREIVLAGGNRSVTGGPGSRATNTLPSQNCSPNAVNRIAPLGRFVPNVTENQFV